tara:strand:- start:349 stop:543 length:195 start_codon:yes stop_codon:yes gene_type:complete
MKSYRRSVRRNQRAGRRVSKRMNRNKSVRKLRTRSRKSKGIMAQIGGFLRDLSPGSGFRTGQGN